MTGDRVLNFSAGPAVLPEQVLKEAAAGVLEIAGSGMSILEVSHRGKEYEAIHADACDRLLRTLGLSADHYQPLFLGGGASLQFAMVPMNFLGGATADYVHTGEWSKKAIEDGNRFGHANVVASSEDRGFSYIPAVPVPGAGSRYLHITTNNTIEGTEFSSWPESGNVPLVADISSDIFARNRDHSRCAMLYAGAQKNAGPAGVTLVVIRRDFLESAAQDLPPMLSYRTQAKGNSLYNTPPVFPIYVVSLVLRWIEESGGLAAMETRNRAKAQVIYDALDADSGTYEPTVSDPRDRSLMNITFRLRDTSREQAFLDGAKARRMVGLKGHRSVGGFRASVYNAFPHEGCCALAEYLGAFAAGRA